MPDRTTDELLRPLGAFERVIDLYVHRNPVQFSITAELTRDVSDDELSRALRELARAHPLLAAGVHRPEGDEDPAALAVFRNSDHAIPVRVARRTTWQHEAAREQTEPIGAASSPLARAVLIPVGSEGAGATVVVTFAHQIADGRGALRAVQDLVALLAGRRLTR